MILRQQPFLFRATVSRSKLAAGSLLVAGVAAEVHKMISFPALWDTFILKLNRNAREPKLANHGARPNSSVMRRLRRMGSYRKWKEKTVLDSDESNPKHGHLEGEDEKEDGDKKPSAG